MSGSKIFSRYILGAGAAVVSATLFGAVPALALNNKNEMIADPSAYFPGCACSSVFFSFVLWMIVLLVIAMFQYSEWREKKLSAYTFSIIAIILAFIIFSIPFGAFTYMLQPSNFEINEETGKYHFSQYGEKDELTGSYTRAEVEDHILKSRTGVFSSWIILGVVCIGAGLSIPAYLKRRDEKKKQAQPQLRKKRKSKGRIGTRVTKPRDEKAKKGKKK